MISAAKVGRTVPGAAYARSLPPAHFRVRDDADHRLRATLNNKRGSSARERRDGCGGYLRTDGSGEPSGSGDGGFDYLSPRQPIIAR